MHFSQPLLVAALASLSTATPIDINDVETKRDPTGLPDLLPDVLSITNLDYEWHEPTANDLHIMSGNGTYDSNEEGLPLSGLSFDASAHTASNKEKRQSGVYRTNSALVGDGNPHQNPYQQQQTPTVNCGPGSTCSVGITRSHSLSWSASANAAYGWISGGFGVQETFSKGWQATCNGNAGSSVCIWFGYGVTAYTVSSTSCYYYQGRPSMCRNLGTRILYSPNNCQPRNIYCVRGSACRNENSGYYVKDNAPAGGPPC